MLSTLPPEIILDVLKYLNIRQLHQLQLLSREWRDFAINNETSIYRAAAVFHHFVPPGLALSEAKCVHPGPWLERLESWKDFCQRWFRLERSWEGRDTSSRTGALSNTETDVHRFKIDDKHRFVVTTHIRGGLLVTSMDDDTTIFSISTNYVRRHAHCEYGNGFLIFDRLHPHALEVWRLETDSWDLSVPSGPLGRHLPDESQYIAARTMTIRRSDPLRTGRFSPWSLIIPPDELRAYRFVYPTLLVGSEHSQALYLFDIPSATLTQTIPLVSHPVAHAGGELSINYVELGARHAFVCTVRGLLIVPRDSSEGARMILEMPSPEMGLRIPELARHTAAQIIGHYAHVLDSAMLCVELAAPQEPDQDTTALVRLSEARQMFTAVHVSPSGKDFAAINWHGLLYLVQDFERVARGEVTFADISLRVNLQAPAMHLAFEHGRVAVQTSAGIYIINWDTTKHAVIDSHSSPNPPTNQLPVLPHLTMFQLGNFTNRNLLLAVDCLQLTKTGVWVTWAAFDIDRAHDDSDSEDDWRNGLRAVCYLDFAPRHGTTIEP